jgi:hypothetical protein
MTKASKTQSDSLPATLTNFTPVPRKRVQHSGWVPERQRKFIEALAETGNATRAAKMVNMSVVAAYQLRRAPGAEGFRKAWNAALDCGVERIRDLAFERAVEGERVPIFYRGRLLGHRRKFDTQLLMFILRHYGRDGQGRTVSVNYFKAKAGAGTGGSDAEASAETTTMHVRSSGPARGRNQDCVAIPDDAGKIVDAFGGEILDPETMAQSQERLVNEAKFLRDVQGNWDDPLPDFVPHKRLDPPYSGQFEPDGEEWHKSPIEGEQDWDAVDLKGFAEGTASDDQAVSLQDPLVDNEEGQK